MFSMSATDIVVTRPKANDNIDFVAWLQTGLIVGFFTIISVKFHSCHTKSQSPLFIFHRDENFAIKSF